MIIIIIIIIIIIDIIIIINLNRWWVRIENKHPEVQHLPQELP
jgi:hypothetical protein